MLSEQNLAKLTNRLQIPAIVQDIMNDEGMLTPDVQYALHEILSDQQPDSALLSIALGARKVAARYQHLGANMAILKMECDRVINDYAELWVRNAESKSLDDNLVFDTLEQIPEDLEVLAELLEINAGILLTQREDLATILKVFAVQARAQVLIADTFIDLIDNEAEFEQTLTHPPIAHNDNVIPFPGGLRAS